MKYPKILKTSGQNYTIIINKSTADKNMGETDRDASTIELWVGGGIKAERVRETLLHEILHIAFEDVVDIVSASRVPPFEAEENIIRIVSPRLFSILLDNPEVLSFILGKGKSRGKK